MDRRRFIRAGLGTVGGATVLGSVGSASTDVVTGQPVSWMQSFPSYDIPRYSDWVPAESHADTDAGVFFTHIDWEAIDQLESEDESETTDEDVAAITEQMPIVGLPLYGMVITPLALFGILFYPFSDTVLPEEGSEVEGVHTTTTTWTNNRLVFHGAYSPDVFAEQYAEGFEASDGGNGFTLYVGADEFTDGMTYAISEETLVVGMPAGEEDDYVPEEIVRTALDQAHEESGRVADTEDGRWLFETTGDAQAVFGGWEMEDLSDALETTDESDNESATAGTDSVIERNPVFDAVESVVNTLHYAVEDGEMRDIETRFSGLYPDDVPTESEVTEYLIGNPEIPHTIVIDENRVHASTTFEERPIV